MTLTQLRAFLAAYDLGSFTAAAGVLGISQASVSELVARMERENDIQLFVRGSRRLVPTAAADELLSHALEAVTAIEAGMDSLRSLTSLEGGVCTFGVLRNAAYYNLSDLVLKFHRQHPRVKIRLVGLNSALVAESIARGEVEAGIIVLPVPELGLHIKPLFRDEVLYASATRDPEEGPITLEELAQSPLVFYDAHAGWRDPTRRQLLERARQRGMTIDPAIEVEHVETALNLVAAGSANTVVSRSVARSTSFPRNVRTVPFAEPIFDTIAFAQRERGQMSPATRKLASLAQSILLERIAPEQQLGAER